MKQTIIVGTIGITVSAIMLGLGIAAGSNSSASEEPMVIAAAPENIDTDKAAIEAIIKNYLIANPEIMLDVQAALETKQREKQRIAQLEAISSHSEAIFRSSKDGIVGNPDGNVTIVEFFDYNCGYCKRALSDMNALVSTDSELRFVLKEFPILGDDSKAAHVVSMAFRTLYPEEYPVFHRRLLGDPGRANEDKAMAIALDLGADEAALRQEMQNPEIQQIFSNTYELANNLSISGTPSYVVGDEVVFGALGRDVLGEKVANYRNCESTVC